MGEPLRRRDVPVDTLDAGAPDALAAEIETIARAREAIGVEPVEPRVAGRLERGFATIRQLAVDAEDLPLAEIALSGELVFGELSRRPAALSAEDLGFLDNVIAVMRELGETAGAPRHWEAPDAIADAFDRLLARLETM